MVYHKARNYHPFVTPLNQRIILAEIEQAIGMPLRNAENSDAGPCFSVNASGQIIRLDLSHCYLPFPPAYIGNIETLESLILVETSLKALPRPCNRLSKLRLLDLRVNPSLEILPSIISSLHSLETLSIADTGIVELPGWISTLPHLKKCSMPKKIGPRNPVVRELEGKGIEIEFGLS